MMRREGVSYKENEEYNMLSNSQINQISSPFWMWSLYDRPSYGHINRRNYQGRAQTEKGVWNKRLNREA